MEPGQGEEMSSVAVRERQDGRDEEDTLDEICDSMRKINEGLKLHCTEMKLIQQLFDVDMAS